MTEYRNLVKILELGHNRQNNLLFLNGSDYLTYDNKQIVFIYGFYHLRNKQTTFIEFQPLNEQKQSCSHLLIVDTIHLHLKNQIYTLFNRILRIKDGTHPNLDLTYKLDKTQIDLLPNPTSITRCKFNYLFNAINSIPYSRELITFSIDFNNTLNRAKIDFKYPLYDELSTLRNNTLFGIYLEDFEIVLFKKIYKTYIIEMVNKLFNEAIEIPKNSNPYPQYYTLLKIKVILQEAFWKEYNISNLLSIKRRLKKYNKMLDNLNQFTYMLSPASKEQQELDLQSYKNELEARKEYEPNWLKLKDTIMEKKNKLITQEEIDERFNKQYWNNYIQKISALQSSRDIELTKLNYEQMKNQTELVEILNMQRLVLAIINGEGGRLWFDTRTKKYSFRSEYNGVITEYNQKDMTAILNKAMQKNLPKYHTQDTDFLNHMIEVVLVESTNDIAKYKIKDEYKISKVAKVLIFTSTIPTINGDVFNLNYTEEIFQSETDLLYKRNRFVPTKYLSKRYPPISLVTTINHTGSFIEKFIYYLVKENEALSNYIMNWLAYYFQNLQKTKTALVLLGNQEVTEGIFWNVIIKEIIGEKYCSLVNDNEYDSSLVSDIAKDKLFFNIGDIDDAGSKFDDKTLALIIKELLIKSSVSDNENNQVEIYGQMIITATNPAPYLKKALSGCTVIETASMDTILDKLDIEDETELEDKILEDLDTFANTLLRYKVNINEAINKMDTEARKILKNNITPNIDKDEIEQNIDSFIQAIKDKDIEYFEKVKEVEDGKIYDQLKSAFNDGYFIGQDLYKYYNAIYEHSFKTNTALMNKLKKKDDMFKQEVKTLKILTAEQKEKVLFQAYKTSSETKYKELYKINGYTPAKDITIPDGAVIISSQDSIKKYNHPDLENALKLHKEYKEKKDKTKAKK